MTARPASVGAVLGAAGGATLTALGLVTGEGAAAALPGAVAALLATAGVSASVPVVGWVIAGLAGATAGSIALVTAIRAGRHSKASAALAARDLDLADVDGIAGYVVRVLGKSPQWRADESAAILAKIRRNPDKSGKARRKDVERLRFLTIVDLQEEGAKSGKLPKTRPIPELAAGIPPEPDPTPWGVYALAAGATLAIIKWVL